MSGPISKATAAHMEPEAYTQPPPSYDGYAAESSSAPRNQHEPLLGGEQRDSMDNIPDDFKYSTSVGDSSIEIRHAFVRKVYSILFVQLLLTGIVSAISFWSPDFKFWIRNNAWMMWVSFAGAIGFLFATYWKRKSYPTNLLFLGAFTLFEAYTVAVATSFYDTKIVLEALLLTGIVFLGLTLFSFQTKYDFTSWAPYLFGGLWLLIGFGLVASFSNSNGMQLAYAGGATLLFSGYIIVDTQLILYKYHVEEEIAAAISLYLDIINLFLAILRILNNQNNN